MKRCCCKASLLLTLCLLLAAVALPSFAVTPRVILAGQKESYTLGENLQLQAQLVPMQDAVQWEWRCRMPGAEEETVVGWESKLLLDLTADYRGATICPVAILADGTTVRGPEKVLEVAFWYSGLELAASPNKVKYKPGEAFAPAGVKIFALRGDGSREDVTARCTFVPGTMELGVAEVRAVCTLLQENGEDAKFGCIIPVTVTASVSKPENPDNTQAPDDAEKPDDAGEPDAADKPSDWDGPAEKPNWSESRDGSKIVLWLCIGTAVVAGLVFLGWYCYGKGGKEEEKNDPAP